MCWQLLKRQQLHPLTVVALVATELVVGLDEEPEGAAPPLLRRSSRPMLLLGAGLLSWGRAWAAVDCGAAGLLVRDRCVEGDDVAARLLKNCMQGDRPAHLAHRHSHRKTSTAALLLYKQTNKVAALPAESRKSH